MALTVFKEKIKMISNLIHASYNLMINIGELIHKAFLRILPGTGSTRNSLPATPKYPSITRTSPPFPLFSTRVSLQAGPLINTAKTTTFVYSPAVYRNAHDPRGYSLLVEKNAPNKAEKAILKEHYETSFLPYLFTKAGFTSPGLTLDVVQDAIEAIKFDNQLSREERESALNSFLKKASPDLDLLTAFKKLASTNLNACITLFCMADAAELARFGVKDQRFLIDVLKNRNISEAVATEFLDGLKQAPNESAMDYAQEKGYKALVEVFLSGF
jgi:hypothetical protein